MTKQVFEALVLMLVRQMPYRVVGRIMRLSPHRVMAIRERGAVLAVAQSIYFGIRQLAIDETSRAKLDDLLAQLATERTARLQQDRA